MRKLLVSIFTMLLCVFGYAQELPTIIPPSPEASALSEFTNVPVSHYTGLPNISVPIYTIQQKGITIPINLSYHARGVMVSETAPRTGMGWSLVYGGSISRQQRGKPDESTYLGYLANKQHFIDFSSNKATRDAVHSIEQNNPDYDFYPDQFSFNAGGSSGKFVFNYVDGEPVVQSFGDIDVSYTREGGFTGKIDSFVITDSKGNKYYYGISKDGTRAAQDFQISSGMSLFYGGNVVLDQPSGAEISYSSWKLMDIETMYGEVISYFYEGESGANSSTTYYRKSHDKHNPHISTTVTNSLGNMNNIQEISSRVSKISNFEKQLTKIEFNQGRDRVVFTKSQDFRADFEGYSLDKISILNDDKIIKSFNLKYSYTTSADKSNILGYFIGSSVFSNSFKRMFLSSVEEEAGNGQKLPPYTFTYDPTILPSTLSSRQDYWGYYNGATNNGPFTRMFEYGAYKPNRRVDLLKSEAGILKEIQYPTGGVSKFTYEHNRGSVPGEFSNLIVPGINPGSESEVEIVLKKSDFTYNQTSGSYTPNTIQIPPSTEVTYRFECFHLRDVDDITTPDCLFNFLLDGELISLNQNVVRYTKRSDIYSGHVTINVLTPNFPGVDHNQHLTKNYDFRLVIKYVNPDDRSNLCGAGKRIKKIENISENGIISTKEYEYNFPSDVIFGGSGRNSGGIIGLPSYINKSEGYAPMFLTTYTGYNDASSSYSSFQPNSIGYSSVIEYHGTKQSNTGKIEYTFTNLSDTGGDYYDFPYHPPTDNEWLRGKNIKTKIFKSKENGGYSLTKETYNKYLYGNKLYTADFEYPGFQDVNFSFTPEATKHNREEDSFFSTEKNKILFKMPLFMGQRLPFGDPNYDVLNDVAGYRIYHLTGGTVNLQSTTETNYFDGKELSNKTEYFYNYEKHYQLKKTKQTNSKGDVLLSETVYPQDKTTTLSFAENKLETNHRFVPIESYTYQDLNKDGIGINTELLSSQKTVYDNTTWPGLNLISKVQTLKGIPSATNVLEDRVVYHAYDAKGNPTEISKKDGTHIVYIWGYNQTQPIAKIENATLSQVNLAISTLHSDYNTLVKIQDASNADNDRTIGEVGKEGVLRTALGALRIVLNLSESQITTFTYDLLIGVTSVTDPRGQVIYYEYDSFNRLWLVKDSEGNILKENQYNYKD